eukprot:gnl/MRDRNA2_/MRDRNA2_104768_c0_seq1.p1 gnl/MRDRNA2_/MRDRNA2_104768_c0~~gnl/MRDRNA2_/MRDRNA2_104768_c0_seq1.p1  ORF type:complete len:327 (-),score=92.15 gnl/MRDRNA2_/MRDRNA2_104768_c0_seq1:45-1025(-)
MVGNMWFVALIVAFVPISDATRSLRSKPHREALLVTSESEGEQLSTRAGVSEKMVQLESQTNQLLSFIDQVQGGLDTALVQLESLAEHANATKAAPVAANATETKAPNMTKAANKTQETKPQNATKTAAVVSNSTKAPAVNLKHLSPAEFKKAVKDEQDVLNNLFKHLKVNIANFNKQETKDKDKTAAIRKRLEDRLKKDKATLAMKNISDFERERLTNSTRMEQHELDYWNRDRDLQHHMFHSNLKMTHGLMSRVKTVIEAYSQAFKKGKIDPALMKQVHAMSPTKAAFLEMRKDVRERAHTYKVHLRLGMQISHPPHRESGSLI